LVISIHLSKTFLVWRLIDDKVSTKEHLHAKDYTISIVGVNVHFLCIIITKLFSVKKNTYTWIFYISM
jgi:hypothetical protein